MIAPERKVYAYRKGQSIFREGEEVKGIYFVSEGAVKIHRYWGGGKEFILRWAGSGEVIGHRGKGNGHRFPVSATVLAPTTVCFITSEFLEGIFTTHPSFLYAMMELYASELTMAENRMRDLAIMPVSGRVAEALFTIREVFGTDGLGFTRIPVTRLDIACHAGTTYEAVFRLLSEWSREGLICTSGKNIRILEEKRLREFIQIR